MMRVFRHWWGSERVVGPSWLSHFRSDYQIVSDVIELTCDSVIVSALNGEMTVQAFFFSFFL